MVAGSRAALVSGDASLGSGLGGVIFIPAWPGSVVGRCGLQFG